jgi:flagellar export protein FliJ
VDLSAARLQAAATLRDDQEARRSVLELAAVMRKLETARKDLAAAAARRRAMELLRDRDRERFLAEQNHREQTALDDLVIMRQRGDI